MLCDKCGQEDATVHLVEIRRGIPAETHLCEKCAELYLPLERTDLAELLEQMPPRAGAPDNIYREAAAEPGPGEAEMTASTQHVLVGTPFIGTLVQVSPETGGSFTPVWSPTGKLLVHVWLDRRRYALRVSDAFGRQSQCFHDVSWGEPPQWTPDGLHLCFSLAFGDVRCPVLGDVRTGELTHLAARPDLDQYDPVLSPDGKFLALLSGPPSVPSGDAAQVSLEIVGLAGGRRRRLLSEPERRIGQVEWSPDGKRLAVLLEELPAVEPTEVLELAELGRQELRVLAVADGKVLFSRRTVAGAVWSPDGSHLLVARYLDGDVVLECADLAGPARILGQDVYLPGGTLSAASWSADGRSVGFTSGAEGHRHLTIAGLDGAVRTLPLEDVKAVAFNPLGPELAVLRKERKDHEVLLVERDDPEKRRTVLAIGAESFYDVVGLCWSPTGKHLALEAHSARLRTEGT